MKIYKTIIAAILILSITACSNSTSVLTSTNETVSNTNVTSTKKVDESCTWNLSELYESKEELFKKLDSLKNNEMAKVIDSINKFEKPSDLYPIILLKNEIITEIKKMSAYASLKQSLDAKDNDAYDIMAKLQKETEDLYLAYTKLDNIILSKDKSFIDELKKDEALMKVYARELNILFKNKEHTLSAEEEKALIASNESLNNYTKIYEVLNYSEMPHDTIKTPDGEMVKTDYSNLLIARKTKDRNYRKEFFEKFMDDLKKFESTYALNINGHINLYEDLAKKHNYKNGLESALVSEYLDEDFYNALIEGARNAAPIRKRYFDILKKQLSLDELWQYDLAVNAVDLEEPTFTYDEAKKILLDALSIYGDEYTNVLKEALNNRWIDVYPKEGKRTGAYSMALPNYHPFVLCNYTDNYNSLSTLFHELGHTVNQYFSDKKNISLFEKGLCQGVTEVASTSNELLLNNYMKNKAKTKEEKLFYLYEGLSLLNGTFFSQALYSDFEREMHKLVEEGDALTAEKLNSIYKEVFSTYNPSVKTLENNAVMWANVPHFYSDYYVYDYALAISVACNVVNKIENNEAGFMDKYLNFLTLGDSMDTVDIFKTIDVDITNPHFVDALANRYIKILDEIESLTK